MFWQCYCGSSGDAERNSRESEVGKFDAAVDNVGIVLSSACTETTSESVSAREPNLSSGQSKSYGNASDECSAEADRTFSNNCAGHDVRRDAEVQMLDPVQRSVQEAEKETVTSAPATTELTCKDDLVETYKHTSLSEGCPSHEAGLSATTLGSTPEELREPETSEIRTASQIPKKPKKRPEQSASNQPKSASADVQTGDGPQTVAGGRQSEEPLKVSGTADPQAGKHKEAEVKKPVSRFVLMRQQKEEMEKKREIVMKEVEKMVAGGGCAALKESRTDGMTWDERRGTGHGTGLRN